jgi:hypothetical protein
MSTKSLAIGVFCVFLAGSAALGDEPSPRPSRGALGTGANIGQAVTGQLGQTAIPASSPFSRGIGQVVSGWTHDGIHGTELAQRIHQLQGKDLDHPPFRNQLNGDRDRRDFDRDRDDRSEAEKIGSRAGKNGLGPFKDDLPGNRLGQQVNPGRSIPFGKGGRFGKGK